MLKFLKNTDKQFNQIALCAILLFMVGIIYGQTNGEFEFPEWFVAIMSFFAPLIIQWVKGLSDKYVIRAALAGVLSFVTAIIGILITGTPFDGLLGLFILAYAIAQIAYNLFWHGIFGALKK